MTTNVRMYEIAKTQAAAITDMLPLQSGMFTDQNKEWCWKDADNKLYVSTVSKYYDGTWHNVSNPYVHGVTVNYLPYASAEAAWGTSVLSVDGNRVLTIGEGAFIPDSKILKLGGTTTNNDLSIFSNGTNSIISSDVINLLLMTTNGSNLNIYSGANTTLDTTTTFNCSIGGTNHFVMTSGNINIAATLNINSGNSTYKTTFNPKTIESGITCEFDPAGASNVGVFRFKDNKYLSFGTDDDWYIHYDTMFSDLIIRPSSGSVLTPTMSFNSYGVGINTNLGRHKLVVYDGYLQLTGALYGLDTDDGTLLGQVSSGGFVINCQNQNAAIRLQCMELNILELRYDGANRMIGFFASTPVSKPTVSGSKGSNAALGSLITALANLGLVTDSTSA